MPVRIDPRVSPNRRSWHTTCLMTQRTAPSRYWAKNISLSFIYKLLVSGGVLEEVLSGGGETAAFTGTVRVAVPLLPAVSVAV